METPSFEGNPVLRVTFSADSLCAINHSMPELSDLYEYTRLITIKSRLGLFFAIPHLLN